MADARDKLDEILDEVARELTDGAPRPGFTYRVLSRIAEHPSRRLQPLLALRGWPVRASHLVPAAAAVACAVAAVLIIPLLLRTGGQQPAEPAAAVKLPAADAQATGAPESRATVVQSRESQQLAAGPQPRGVATRADPDLTRVRLADDADCPIACLTIAPLPGPDPLLQSPIEIAPIEIQPLVIPEIVIPPLDVGGPVQEIRQHQEERPLNARSPMTKVGN